jgi:integron integrase
MAQKSKLLADFQVWMTKKGLSYHTEQSYVQWAKRFILYYNKTHPLEMAEPEVQAYLSYLAVEREVRPSTQNQAFHALINFYQFLGKPLFNVNATRAKKKTRIPVVLSRNDVLLLLDHITKPPYPCMAELLYGSGLRISECVRLRVKDLLLDRLQVIVRSGKGDKDRLSLLTDNAVPLLQAQLVTARRVYDQDRRSHLAGVYLPPALSRKYPSASTSWEWFWVFPSIKRSDDPRDDVERRHHWSDHALRKYIKQAAKQAGFDTTITPHVLRHCFATHLLEAGLGDGRTLELVRQYMGHDSIETTKIYLHCMQRGRNPLSR